MLMEGRLIQVRETMIWLFLDLLRLLGEGVAWKWKDNTQATPSPWPPKKVPQVYHFSGQ